MSVSFLGRELIALSWRCDCTNDTEGADPTLIGGGSGHDFERDTTPLDPTDHYGDWEDRTRFGFGGVS